MSELWNRDYLQRRVERCEWLAARARITAIRQTHLRFAGHYRRIIAALPL